MAETIIKYRALLGEIDAWYRRSMERYPQLIACQSGCSECCRSLFDITLLDAYVLKQGFDELPQELKQKVLGKCRDRLERMRESWPEFDHPYLLNHRPEEEWSALMPEDDETPCVLLGDDGRCLVYESRPMTCRLHGLPMLDLSGEVMHDEWCTLNFPGTDPLELDGLRAPFDELIRREVALIRDFTGELLHKRLSQLDTFIPAAPLIDFAGFDWQRWLAEFKPAEEE
jgi:Fe-S-cluster containining protein